MILEFLKGFNVDGKRKQTNFEEKIKKGIKLHTVRLDSKNRWKKDMKIHFATGASSKYNCFKEGICTETQEITILDQCILIDGRELDLSEEQYFSDNDGFDSVNDFWAWFDQYSPFEGKIIHWTNLRY